jgi:hypothetical protein
MFLRGGNNNMPSSHGLPVHSVAFTAFLLVVCGPGVAENNTELDTIRELYTQTRDAIHSFSGGVNLAYTINFDPDKLSDRLARANTDLWVPPPDKEMFKVHRERFSISGDKLFFQEQWGPSEQELICDEQTAWNGAFYTSYSAGQKAAVLDDDKDEKGRSYTALGVRRAFHTQSTSLDASMLYKRIISSNAVYKDIPFLLSRPDATLSDEEQMVNGVPCMVVRIPSRKIVLYFDRQLNFAVRKAEDLTEEGVPWHTFENLEFAKDPSSIGMHLPIHSRETFYLITPPPYEPGDSVSWWKDCYYKESIINPDLPDDLFYIDDYPPETLVKDRITGRYTIAGDMSGIEASVENRFQWAAEKESSPPAVSAATESPAGVTTQQTSHDSTVSSYIIVALGLVAGVLVGSGVWLVSRRRKS